MGDTLLIVILNGNVNQLNGYDKNEKGHLILYRAIWKNRWAKNYFRFGLVLSFIGRFALLRTTPPHPSK